MSYTKNMIIRRNKNQNQSYSFFTQPQCSGTQNHAWARASLLYLQNGQVLAVLAPCLDLEL